MPDLMIFSNTLRGMLRARRLVWVCLLALLPGALALIIRLNTRRGDWDGHAAYDHMEQNIVFGFILVMMAVIYGTGAISQEVEQKTIVYLLTRPIHRWRILLMKFLATTLLTTVSVYVASAVVALVSLGPSSLSRAPFTRDLLVLPVGALAYSGLFVLVAAALARSLLPLILGLLYAFGWETLVPLLPGDMKMLSLMSYLHELAPHPAAQPQQTANPFLALAQQSDITPRISWIVLAAVIAVTLGMALLVFSLREYVPRED